MAFGDFKTAAAMRDAIEEIATGIVKRLRPEERVAEVLSVNTQQLTAEVRLPGDTGSLNVRFGLSLQPRQTGVLVRVSGHPGNYYITEILNDTGVHATYEPLPAQVDGLDTTINGPGGLVDQIAAVPAPDGSPPASSPAATVRAFGYSGLLIEWPAVVAPDPVKYRVFLDTVNPPVLELTETAALAHATSTLGNGTQLAPGTVYYAQVEAYEEVDGNAPSKGTVGSGSPLVIPADAVSEDILVANEIYSRLGYFGAIHADAIESGSGLFANLNILGELSLGGGITMDKTNGIVINTPQGDTTFPTDGSDIILKADVTASALEVLGALTIRGTNNDISKNSELSLATGVATPKSQPTIYSYWPSYNAHEGYQNRSLVQHTSPTPDLWYSTESFVGDCGIMAMNVDGSGHLVHNLTSWSLTTTGGRPEAQSAHGGMCMIGETAYMLVATSDPWTGTYNGRWYVYKMTYNSPGNWTYVTRWRYLTEADTTILSGRSNNHPTIGTNGTDIFIAQAASNGVHYMTQYSTTGTLIAAPAAMKQDDGTTNFTTNRNCVALIWTAADTGTARWWLVHESYANVYCFSSTRVRVSANEFPTASTGNQGFAYDVVTGRFKGRTTNKLYHYSKIKDTDIATNPINIVHTWRLADATGPDFAAGETSASPRAQTAGLVKRSTLWITTTAIPNDPGDASDPDAVTFYIARGTGTPANTAYQRVVPPAVGATVQIIDELPTSGGNPPLTTTGFGVGGTPALIQSTATDGDGAQIKLSGEGSGRVGPLKWAANTPKGVVAAKLVSAATAQGIVHNTWTMSNLDETSGIEYNYGMTVGSNGFTITEAGLYTFTASATFGLHAVGRRLMQIEKYTTEAVGAGIIVCRAETFASSTAYASLVMAGEVYMNVNDKVRIAVLHTAGSGVNLDLRHDLVLSYLTARMNRI